MVIGGAECRIERVELWWGSSNQNLVWAELVPLVQKSITSLLKIKGVK